MGPSGDMIERTNDTIIASKAPGGQIKNTQVVEDFRMQSLEGCECGG